MERSAIVRGGVGRSIDLGIPLPEKSLRLRALRLLCSRFFDPPSRGGLAFFFEPKGREPPIFLSPLNMHIAFF